MCPVAYMYIGLWEFHEVLRGEWPGNLVGFMESIFTGRKDLGSWLSSK